MREKQAVMGVYGCRERFLDAAQRGLTLSASNVHK